MADQSLFQKQCNFHTFFIHIAYQSIPLQPSSIKGTSQNDFPMGRKGSSNKNSIISYFLLFSMNSERYNERLHQIKEKYGRVNHTNPEETHRQRSYKRETTPLHPQAQNNKHVNCQEASGKPLRKELRLENQQQYRRDKQNCPTAPLSQLKNQSPIGRGCPDNQQKRFQWPTMHKTEFPISQRPSIYGDYPIKNLSPRNANQNSPIRKLQSQLDNQSAPRHTPRQYANNFERPPPLTPPKSNIALNAYTPHNLATSPLSKPSQISAWRQNQRDSRIPERPAGISQANEMAITLPRKGQQFHHQSQINNFNGEKGSKPVFSLNNIASIQERIQMALNSNKK